MRGRFYVGEPGGIFMAAAVGEVGSISCRFGSPVQRTWCWGNERGLIKRLEIEPIGETADLTAVSSLVLKPELDEDESC